MKIIKILNLPELEYRKVEDKIMIRVRPKVYGADSYQWFGTMIIQGVKLQNKELTEVLKEGLWELEEKRKKRKRYFILKPVAKGIPDCYWMGVSQPTNYTKELVRTVMKGESFRKHRYEKILPDIRKIGKVLEIDNTQRKIEMVQIAPNGARLVLSNKNLEKMAFLFHKSLA